MQAIPQPTEPDHIVQMLLNRFEGTTAIEAWGETSVFYNPGLVLPRGVYFATVKQKDGANDRASELDRAHVFRFNLGTSKPLFFERFGRPPTRPKKGQAIDGPWNFTELELVTPHPVYGWMSWVSVLNPSAVTLIEIEHMIQAAFEKAKASFYKKRLDAPANNSQS